MKEICKRATDAPQRKNSMSKEKREYGSKNQPQDAKSLGSLQDSGALPGRAGDSVLDDAAGEGHAGGGQVRLSRQRLQPTHPRSRGSGRPALRQPQRQLDTVQQDYYRPGNVLGW